MISSRLSIERERRRSDLEWNKLDRFIFLMFNKFYILEWNKLDRFIFLMFNKFYIKH